MVARLSSHHIHTLRTGESLEAWHYDVDAAGQRFLVTTPVEDALLSTITVLVQSRPHYDGRGQEPLDAPRASTAMALF
jgi:hypothetical protein